MAQEEYQKSNVKKIREIILQKNEEGLELIRLMQLYLLKKSNKEEFVELTTSNIPPSQINETGYKPIGTWIPILKNKEIEFVRSKQDDTVFWESSCDSFPLKKKCMQKRICVIGESVAAGMFFTPHLSPTKMLAEYLELYSEESWDVIDLTRNSMNAGALLETCKAALQLEPDYIVVIAGNNWYTDIAIEHDGILSNRRMYVEELDEEGIHLMIEKHREKSIEFAKKILHEIDNISEEVETQFLFLLPTVNYKDWERRYPLHWLENGKTSRWYETLKQAICALENKNYELGLKYGLEMIELDCGTNATSNRIVANCLIGLGRCQEACLYCAKETENSLIFDEITSFPGMPYSVRKEIIQNQERFKHICFFDMEEILKKSLKQEIVGAPIFVDYCHLSPEGYKVIMAPIAEYVANCKFKIGREEKSISQ